MIKVYLKDLVANAIIEVASRTQRTYVTGRELNNYGREVIANLKTKNIRAKLELSKEEVSKFRNTYQEYFIVSGDGFQLNENKSIENVIDSFRGNMSYEVLLSLVDDQVVNKSFNLYSPKQKHRMLSRKNRY